MAVGASTHRRLPLPTATPSAAATGSTSRAASAALAATSAAPVAAAASSSRPRRRPRAALFRHRRLISNARHRCALDVLGQAHYPHGCHAQPRRRAALVARCDGRRALPVERRRASDGFASLYCGSRPAARERSRATLGGHLACSCHCHRCRAYNARAMREVSVLLAECSFWWQRAERA